MANDDLFKNQGLGVTVSNVTKRYEMAAGEVHALRDTSWDVKKGSAVAIMGPSGCGKTTLLNLLGGVDRPSSGTITIDNQDLTAMNERALETHRLRRVGFVFQFFNLIPSITAFENIELPMVMAGMPEGQCHVRARQLLALVGLEDKGQKRPEELSGGEQQRVGVALALANDPALILADEPTGNLDSTNAAAIAHLLKSLALEHGKTVIMVSHDPKTVELFPTVYSMRDGRFVAPDTPVGAGA
ncbi:MAG TPA: ABC transporter ATP-binding protein [Vicinamibacterales bacterium]